VQDAGRGGLGFEVVEGGHFGARRTGTERDVGRELAKGVGVVG
jgi:hypothetical protein